LHGSLDLARGASEHGNNPGVIRSPRATTLLRRLALRSWSLSRLSLA
jgi:hypothetical protein